MRYSRFRVGMALGYAEAKRGALSLLGYFLNIHRHGHGALLSEQAGDAVIGGEDETDSSTVLMWKGKALNSSADLDSIVGNATSDNVKVLYDMVLKRYISALLVHARPFVGFTVPLEPMTRRIIENWREMQTRIWRNIATTGGSGIYYKMVSIIAERFGLTTLKFKKYLGNSEEAPLDCRGLFVNILLRIGK